jgi:small subunit ribosomal protein S5
MVRATIKGLAEMNSPELIAAKRGKSVEHVTGIPAEKNEG